MTFLPNTPPLTHPPPLHNVITPPLNCHPRESIQSPNPLLPSSSTNQSPTSKTMSWFQKTLTLSPSSRGSYLITDTITSSLPELANYRVGLLTLFIQHTSCALSLNENWDSDVRADMSDSLDRIVPEDHKHEGLYRHDAEGKDDMPAHIKSSLVGVTVTIPIVEGRLGLGTWQGGFSPSFFFSLSYTHYLVWGGG